MQGDSDLKRHIAEADQNMYADKQARKISR